MPIKATCHCGATCFEASEAPASLTECNCSFCSKQGGLWAYYSPDQVTFLKDNKTTPYTTDATTHTHYHCSICGCYAYNKNLCTWGKSGPNFDIPQIAVNTRLFDDFDLSSLPVNYLDGKNFE